MFRIHFCKAWLHYLFGHPREAVELFKEAESYILYGAGHYMVALFHFYEALAHAALADGRDADGLGEILERMDHNLAQLEVWARFAPMNHQHKKDWWRPRRPGSKGGTVRRRHFMKRPSAVPRTTVSERRSPHL